MSKSFVCICLADVYPLPLPGPSATKDPLSLGGKNVTLIMDTPAYPGFSAYFNVCRYNRSIPNKLISCCSCYGNCEFGELTGHTDSNYVTCQLNTSYSGIYQFKIYTNKYPCFLNIGYPIEVNDVNNDSSLHDNHFKLDFHILSYSLGGLCVLLVLGILGTFCVTRRVYKRPRPLYAQLGMYSINNITNVCMCICEFVECNHLLRLIDASPLCSAMVC